MLQGLEAGAGKLLGDEQGHQDAVPRWKQVGGCSGEAGGGGWEERADIERC